MPTAVAVYLMTVRRRKGDEKGKKNTNVLWKHVEDQSGPREAI